MEEWATFEAALQLIPLNKNITRGQKEALYWLTVKGETYKQVALRFRVLEPTIRVRVRTAAQAVGAESNRSLLDQLLICFGRALERK